ncbi:MAG: tRNA (adenosine(37)-N6)-dimethylallyltransferase MiaA [Bacteroidetes bacterium]|nr:tRNA (adenosine(37)-N6)-dimethylallyltransferase MiaA [Bacteroidota bacterium]
MKKTLIVIVGPTAIGKTSLAIHLAEYFRTEILSADSRQFYKEMNVGTAKPTEAERKKIIHHFIDSLSIHDSYNVGQYETDALVCLRKIFDKQDTAVLVGGSGLFVNVVCNGMDQLPESNPELRNELRLSWNEQGIEFLQKKLLELDPEYYETVDRSNPHRLIRAIEVCLQTGLKYSELRKREKKERDFNIIKIGLDDDRDIVYERINNRVEEMMKNGLLKEAQQLFQLRTLNALQTVGYRELFDYMEKKTALEEAVALIRQNTRRYSKRQLTWFRKEEDIAWFRPNQEKEILEFINAELKR